MKDVLRDELFYEHPFLFESNLRVLRKKEKIQREKIMKEYGVQPEYPK